MMKLLIRWALRSTRAFDEEYQLLLADHSEATKALDEVYETISKFEKRVGDPLCVLEVNESMVERPWAMVRVIHTIKDLCLSC